MSEIKISTDVEDHMIKASSAIKAPRTKHPAQIEDHSFTGVQPANGAKDGRPRIKSRAEQIPTGEDLEVPAGRSPPMTSTCRMMHWRWNSATGLGTTTPASSPHGADGSSGMAHAGRRTRPLII